MRIQSLALICVLAGTLAGNTFADEIKRGKDSLPSSKLGEYSLIGGDSVCEGSLVLQKLKLKMSGKVMNAVEMVPSEMALDDYIWRRGLSTLFININGKTVVDRGLTSHRQGHSTTYEASFEDNVLTALEEDRTTYALIPIDKVSTLSTLAFDDSKEQFTLNQVITGEQELQKSCLYQKI